MFVGDLFIELGIKGAEKTIGALGSARKGLKDVSSMSLEAKAALLGVAYALERMMSSAATRGQGISNVSVELGIGKQALQQYEQAAKSAGGSVEELDGTLRTLQTSLTDQIFTGHAAAGFSRVAQLTNIGEKDVKRLSEHPEEMLRKLQEYAGKEKDVTLRNTNLRSFGISPQMIAMLDKQSFSDQKLKAAKQFTFSDKEVDNLDDVAKGLTKLGQVIDTAFGHFTAKHGKELIADIQMLVKPMTQLAEQFVKLSESAHIFDLIKMSLEGWADIIKMVTTGIKEITDVVSDPKSYFDKQKKAYNERQQSHEEAARVAGIQRDVDRRIKEKVLKGETIKQPGYDTRGNPLFINENGVESKNPYSNGIPYPKGPKGKEWEGTSAGTQKFLKDLGEGMMHVRDKKSYDDGKWNYGDKKPDAQHPAAPAVKMEKTNNNHASVDVKQELNFYNDPNPVKKIGDSLHKATKDYFRTSPAQGQIS